MQKILSVTRKEFLLWAQKPGSWILVFIVPFFFIWIVQSVFGTTGTPVVTVFAVNEDAGPGGAQALLALQQGANLKVDELETREEADQRVGAGERMVAIIIPAGFTDAMKTPGGAKVDLIIDPARSEQANIVIGLVNSALAPMIVDAEVSRGVESSVQQVISSISQALTTATPQPGGTGTVTITPTRQPNAQQTPTSAVTAGMTATSPSGPTTYPGPANTATATKTFTPAAQTTSTATPTPGAQATATNTTRTPQAQTSATKSPTPNAQGSVTQSLTPAAQTSKTITPTATKSTTTPGAQTATKTLTPAAQTTTTQTTTTPGAQTTQTTPTNQATKSLTPTIRPSPTTTPTATRAATQLPGAGGQTGSGLTGINLASAAKFLNAALKGVVSSQVQDAIDHPQIQVTTQPAGGSARKPSLLDYLVPGYSLMFVFFLISSLAVTVVEERQTGTLNRLLVAPVSRSQILLGKMLPYFLIAVAQFILVLLVSKLAFGIDLGSGVSGSTTALAILILASAAAMAGLGVLVAAFARTEGQAEGLAIVLVLALAVISGAMFPSISIPGLKMITPHYWAIQGFLNVIARGQGIDGALGPAGILIVMASLFFTIGAIRFRFE